MQALHAVRVACARFLQVPHCPAHGGRVWRAKALHAFRDARASFLLAQPRSRAAWTLHYPTLGLTWRAQALHAFWDARASFLLATRRSRAAWTMPYPTLTLVWHVRRCCMRSGTRARASCWPRPRSRATWTMPYPMPYPKPDPTLSLVWRAQALHAFRDARASFLLATPAAARGLDLPAVSHVYSLGPPASPADYLHRAGRAGRIGAPRPGALPAHAKATHYPVGSNDAAQNCKGKQAASVKHQSGCRSSVRIKECQQ